MLHKTSLLIDKEDETVFFSCTINPKFKKKINLCETLTDYGYGVKDSMVSQSDSQKTHEQ